MLSFEVKLHNQGQGLPNYDLDLDNFDVEWCAMTKQYIWQSLRKIPAGVVQKKKRKKKSDCYVFLLLSKQIKYLNQRCLVVLFEQQDVKKRTFHRSPEIEMEFSLSERSIKQY